MRPQVLKTQTGNLEYRITSRPRVTKRLHMELDEQGGLVVVAPCHWSDRQIKSTMARNMIRVEKFLAKSRRQRLRPLQYIDGEKHLYLGELYPLLVCHVAGRRSHITLVNGTLQLTTPMPQGEKVQAVLQNWYLCQAQVIFRARLSEIVRRAPWAKGKDIPLKLRRMKRTWGNCSSSGVIKLNTHLVKAPLGVIDSVIAHELCHLEEMNHGSAFYVLLEGLNPNWRHDRARLRSESNTYLL
jgi:predicted metal-dependent hydrolase